MSQQDRHTPAAEHARKSKKEALRRFAAEQDARHHRRTARRQRAYLHTLSIQAKP